MLEEERGDVRIVARQHQLREPAGHALGRPHQHFQHVDIVEADLQHDAARHAGRLVAPRGQVDLAETVAADIALGLDELAEAAGVDLVLDPAEMIFAAALIAERQMTPALSQTRAISRPSATVLAIGLSRNTCLPASAASAVVSRCTSFGVVLTIASIDGSLRISS